MILLGSIGDAYGAGFEFQSPDFLSMHNNLGAYHPHGLFPELHRRYTDDTQMAIAIAELLLSSDAWTPHSVAQAFAEGFSRDPRRGYSGRLFDALTMANGDGQRLLDVLSTNSTGNGAAMRAYPIGLLHDLSKVKSYSALQARISHDSEVGVLSAQAVALSFHYFWHGLGAVEQLLPFLRSHTGYPWQGIWEGEVPCEGIATVEAVLSILPKHQTLSALLQDSVAFGGDVDTSAALAMAIGEHIPGMVNDLPAFLHTELENGSFGRDWIAALDQRLSMQFPPRSINDLARCG